jgi:glycogen debranching enzyme
LRSLAPSDPAYVGRPGSRLVDWAAGLHQGPAWPFLLGAYVRATLAVEGDSSDTISSLLRLLEGVVLEGGPVLGQVPQAFEGEEPHRPRGCPAQAWSTAELLAALVLDLGL